MMESSEQNKPVEKDNSVETSDNGENGRQTTIFQANQFNISSGIDPTQIALLAETDKGLADRLIEMEEK